MYAHQFVWMSFAKEILVAHFWAARWTLAGISHLHTGSWSLTALHCAMALRHLQEVLGMLKSIKYFLSAHNCEGKSLSGLDVLPAAAAKTMFLQHWSLGVCALVQVRSTHSPPGQEEELGLLKQWCWGEAALSQAPTHLPAAPGSLKHKKLPG